jgi:hypothetical protein
LAPSCDVRYYRPADRVLAVAARDQLPRRRASSFAVVLLALLRGLDTTVFRVEGSRSMWVFSEYLVIDPPPDSCPPAVSCF